MRGFTYPKLTLPGALTLAAALCGAGCKSAHPGPPPPPITFPADAGGTLYLWQQAMPDGGQLYELAGLFPDPEQATDYCQGAAQKTGACCFFPPSDGGDVGFPLQASVGTITVQDVTTSFTFPGIVYNGYGGYLVSSWANHGWDGGDTLTASAPGQDLYPFTLSTLGPSPISNLQPAWSTPLTIARATDFPVSWTPDPSSQVMRLLLHAASPPDAGGVDHGAIWCQTQDDAGTFTVSAGLLQNFAAGDVCYGCFMARGNDSPMSDGGVLFRVQTTAAGPATYQASFQ